MKIPAKAWIIVADANRYKVYVNEAGAAAPEFRLIAEKSQDNPPSRAQGADRPGRMSTPSTPKSAFDEGDAHQQAETRWIKDLAAEINVWAREDRFAELILVADPRSLGVLRPELSDAARARIAGEIDKDLTKHPDREIARIILDA